MSQKLMKLYKSLSLEQLVEQGYYKAAVALVLFDKLSHKEAYLVEAYNTNSQVKVRDFAHLQRVYGVTNPPDSIDKIEVIKG